MNRLILAKKMNNNEGNKFELVSMEQITVIKATSDPRTLLMVAKGGRLYEIKKTDFEVLSALTNSHEDSEIYGRYIHHATKELYGDGIRSRESENINQNNELDKFDADEFITEQEIEEVKKSGF